MAAVNNAEQLCRLCAGKASPGICIFSISEGKTRIVHLINQNLPLKVRDDGKLPRIICSECHFSLETTVSFFNRISAGQKQLSSLLRRFQDVATEENFDTGASLDTENYKEDELKRCDGSKRGRGRPKKSDKVAEPVYLESLAEDNPHPKEVSAGRRIRKLPVRFEASLQGKELDKVFKEVGLETEDEPCEPEVIGKVAGRGGQDLGAVMVQGSLLESSSRHHMKYRCDTCSLVFTQEPKFLEHIAKCQPNYGEFPSEVSDNSIILKQENNSEIEKENINEDERVCSKESKVFECDVCSKTFRYISSLSYHKETMHNCNRRYVCNKCNRSFRHRQLLVKHQVVHSSARPYTCHECQTSFKTKSNLLNHLLTHSRSQKYYCEICGRMFFYRTSLSLHARWHSGEKPYECVFCKKRFTQKGNLQEHERIHTGEKPFGCNFCGRKFTTSSQQRLHMKRHTGEKPWVCNVCGKQFLYKAIWSCHLRRHKGEKPFSCSTCGREFSDTWSMTKHQRTHTGEKPYSCPICKRAFSDCSNLSKHKKSCSNPNNLFLKSKRGPREQSEDMSQGDETMGQEQIIYVSYTDPQDPTLKVSEKIVVEKEAEEPLPNMMEVMDEMGNPLKFTMEDGTQLQVVTRDGRSLEVRTAEGEIIQVKLTTDAGEPVLPQLTPVLLSPDTLTLPASAEETGSLTEMEGIEIISPEGGTSLQLAEHFLQLAQPI